MTVSKLLIALGINVTGFKAGLSQAKENLRGIQPTVNQLSKGFAAAQRTNILLIAGIYQLSSAIRTTFTGSIKAADEYRLSIINVAATLTDLQGKTAKNQESFNKHLAYAGEMYKVLEIEAAKHFASGKELQLAWTLIAQRGISLRHEEIGALSVIVDKIKLVTQGQMSTVQISQELRSLLNGQARTTDQLARLLMDKYGAAWNDIVRKHREAGDLLTWLAGEFEGLVIASDKIYETLEAQATTLWTLLRRVGREGLSGAYDYIVKVIKTINEYLMEHEYSVSGAIYQAWLGVQVILDAIGEQLLALFDYSQEHAQGVQSSWYAIASAIAEVIRLTGSVISAITEWISNNRTLILSILAIWVAAKGGMFIATMFTSIIAAVNSLIVRLGALSLSFTALGFSIPIWGQIALAITAVVAVLGLAVKQAQNFANMIDSILEKSKRAQAYERSYTPEEFRRKVEEVPSKTYQERMAPATREQQRQIENLVSKHQKLTEQEDKRIENLKAQLPLLQASGHFVEDGTKSAKEEAAVQGKINEILAKRDVRLSSIQQAAEDVNLSLHKTGDYIDVMARVQKFAPEEQLTREESKEVMEANKDIDMLKAGGAQKEKDAKGAKDKLENLWRTERQALEAHLKSEIKAIEASLEKKKAAYEVEQAEMELRIKTNEKTGSDLIKLLTDQANEEFRITRDKLEKQKELNRVSYEAQVAALRASVTEGTTSPAKALLEEKKLYEKYVQRNIEVDKEFYLAGKQNQLELLRITTQVTDARKELISVSEQLIESLAWGPMEEQAVAIMRVKREYDDLANKIAGLKLGGTEPVPEELKKALQDMAIAAELLNRPWAQDFVQAVRDLMTATTPEARAAALEKVKTGLEAGKSEAVLTERIKGYLDGAIDVVESAMNELADVLIDGGKDFQEVAENFFKAMMKQSFQVGFDMLRQALTNVFRSIFNAILGGISGAMPGGGIGFGAFGGFAQHGAILTEPTFLVAGEKGEEAVLPLIKTSKGLGVQAVIPSSMGSPGIMPLNINVINQTSSEVEPTISRQGNDINIVLDEMMADAVGRGGKFTKSMQDVFGANYKIARR